MGLLRRDIWGERNAGGILHLRSFKGSLRWQADTRGWDLQMTLSNLNTILTENAWRVLDEKKDLIRSAMQKNHPGSCVGTGGRKTISDCCWAQSCLQPAPHHLSSLIFFCVPFYTHLYIHWNWDWPSVQEYKFQSSLAASWPVSEPILPTFFF